MELEDLNLPVKVADAVNAGLAAAGIDLPLFFTQLCILVLGLLGLGFGIRKLRAEGITNLLALLVVAGFGLLSLGVLAGWAETALRPLPGEVSGRVEVVPGPGAPTLAQVRVSLLDSRGESVARETGAVDSRTGYFALTHEPSFGERPRRLRVAAPGCEPLDLPLSKARLRAGAAVHVQYRCGGTP